MCSGCAEMVGGMGGVRRCIVVMQVWWGVMCDAW